MGSTGEVLHSSAAVHGGGYKIHMNDVAVIQMGTVVGKVHYDVMLDDHVWTCVSVWQHVHGFMYKVADDQLMLVETMRIRDTCPFSLKDSDAIVVLPARV